MGSDLLEPVRPVPVRHRARPVAIGSAAEPDADVAEGPRVTAAGGAPYEVGFGKPPLHTRFRPGQSGNPNGRRKGAKNLKTLLVEEMSAMVSITESGRARKVTKLQAMVKRLLEKGLKGDLRALFKIFDFALALAPPDELDRDEQSLSADDRALLDAFVHRYASLRREDGQ